MGRGQLCAPSTLGAVYHLLMATDWLAGRRTEVAAEAILDAVAHIDVGAQSRREGFGSIPLAGAYFRSKNDLVPLTDDEVTEAMRQVGNSDDDGPQWL